MSRRMRIAAVLAIIALVVLQQYVGSDDTAPPSTPTASASATPTAPSTPTSVEQSAALPESLRSLPPEAVDTIRLIQSDGPFDHRQDGSVFMNRERRLPAHERGYWREYTVPTPGESDRGARRIVHGAGDEYYYTDDHYRSFTHLRVPDQVRR